MTFEIRVTDVPVRKDDRPWRDVSADDFVLFLKNYPRPLTHSFFMDQHRWHDVTLGDAWESAVALIHVSYRDADTFQVLDPKS